MLEARALTKCFSSIPAVLDVSFRIAPGQVLGYLGPNGSGKSTTVKMLTGLIEPTRGQILYNGESIRTNLVEYKRALGYVPEEANLYPHLTGYEYLELVGPPARPRRQSAASAASRRFSHCFPCFPAAIRPYPPIRRECARGCSSRPPSSTTREIIIFDEPEAGLDITTALVLRKLISSLAQAGKVILYSSHILEVVEKVCTHVLVLHKGNVVAHETIAGIGRLASKPGLEHVFSELTNQTDTDETARGLVEAMRMT